MCSPSNTCVDPCIGLCGSNARCEVNLHIANCVCSRGYTGDPFTNCYVADPREYKNYKVAQSLQFLSIQEIVTSNFITIINYSISEYHPFFNAKLRRNLYAIDELENSKRFKFIPTDYLSVVVYLHHFDILLGL